MTPSLPLACRHGRVLVATAMPTAISVPAVRDTATGQSTPDWPAFLRHRKNSPNPAPAATPYPSPRSRLAVACSRSPAPLASGRPGCGGDMLTRAMAARQIRPPATLLAGGTPPPPIPPPPPPPPPLPPPPPAPPPLPPPPH